MRLILEPGRRCETLETETATMTTRPSITLLPALFVATTACTSPAPGNQPLEPVGSPAPTNPGDQAPVTPSAEPTAAQGSLAEALARVPTEVSALYVFALSEDRRELTIDPAPMPTRRAARDIRGGFSATDSEHGGKVITLDGGPFLHGSWARASFRDRVSSPDRLEDLRRAGYDVDVTRELLVVDGEADSNPTVFAFSHDRSKLGIVGVCSDVTIIDFGVPSPPRPIAVRKPVVYLYPPAPTRVQVQLELDGELVAHYPAMQAGRWSVLASPDGELVDEATGRHHRYLFWEATSAAWELDPKRAHCVPGTEAAAFMERVCERYALTDAECGDFVTYWLPALANNPYSVIELVDPSTYARYARLDVTPQPDAVIRPFMIFRRSDTPVDVGAPELPRAERRGFTVVEWGGANLDEVVETATR